MVAKTHFELDSAAYTARVKAGQYKTSWDGLSFREVDREPEQFFAMFNRIGRPWGWDKTSDRFNEASMVRKFEHPETRLRYLMEDGQDIGYTLIASPEQGLKDRFWPKAEHSRVIEIENLGLLPEKCGGGRGWSFFEMQFQNLFIKYDRVYWSMSHTNHPTLEEYYRRNGMKVLAVDAAVPLQKKGFG